jgi:dTDP-4-amino-4,6-dideoxygalactose transaminase
MDECLEHVPPGGGPTVIPISKPTFGTEELSLLAEVLESGIVAQGSKVEQLEREFAQLAGTRHAVAVSSGTAALHLALLAHGVGPGDEVITTPFTFIGSANCVLYTGARPRFVDVRPDTFNIDPALIEAAITPRTRAILPVHLYGLMADMGPIAEIARRHDLVVLEDAAQAHGARYSDRPAGSFGTACFSLYATKNMTSGEGGLVTTDDPTIADRVRSLRSHGSRRRYYHDELGYNYRMSELHAAVGLAQLRKLPERTARRRANARLLSAHVGAAIAPIEPPSFFHVWHQYTLRVTSGRREAALEYLRSVGVGADVYYPLPVHRQKLYRDLGYEDALPVAEQLAEQVLSVPVHAALSDAELELVAGALERL